MGETSVGRGRLTCGANRDSVKPMSSLLQNGFRLNGRAPKSLHFQVVGELTLLDLQSLSMEQGTKAPSLVKLRNRHHTLARLLAGGTPHGEAGIISGYSTSRVSILLADKAFSELVLFYQKEVDARYLDAHDRMASLNIDIIGELHERLEEEPDEFTINQLNEIMKSTADRTGHGPSTHTTVDVKHGLADRLASARKRLNDDRISNYIDVTPIEETP